MEKVCIGEYNIKVGNCPNTSLPPGPEGSCPPDVPCWIKGCYGKSMYKRMPSIRKAWDRNLRILKENPENYFDQIDFFCKITNERYFRIHVAGDWINQEHFEGWKSLAGNHRKIKFLGFTKNYSIHFGKLPDNLSVRLSVWPGLEMPVSSLPKAFVQFKDGRETRISKGAKLCSGHCDQCQECWEDKLNDVYFIYHTGGRK